MKFGFNLALALALALGFSLAGCSTIQNSFNSKDQKQQTSQSKKHQKAKSVKPKAKHSAAKKASGTPPQATKPSDRQTKVVPGKLNITLHFKDTALYKNRPVSGAMVSVVGKEGGSAKSSHRSKTSESGNCSFVLAEGDYVITISYSKTQKQQSVHIRQGQTRNMTITFP